MSSGKFWRALLKLSTDHAEVVKLWNGYLGHLLGELKAEVKDSKGQPFAFPRLSPAEIDQIEQMPGAPKPDEFVKTGMDFSELKTKGYINCSGLVFWQANFNSASSSYYADFRGANFYGETGFYKASFSGGASFRGTTFSGTALFSSASFDGDADFIEASFDGGAHFESASFSGEAAFNKASFDGDADFNKARFSSTAYFSDASFDSLANFWDASFSGNTCFTGVTFFYRANFNNATFSEYAYFSDASFDDYADFENATFSGDFDFSAYRGSDFSAYFESATFSHRAIFRGVTFSCYADFNSASFFDEANFNDTKFNVEASFNKAIFKKYPPSFHEATLHQNTSFLDPKWPKIPARAAPPHPDPARLDEERNKIDYGRRAWERLAQIMSEQNRYHQVREFAIEEMRWRRMLERKWSLLTFVNWLYEQTCGYGYSLRRAFYYWFGHIIFGGVVLHLLAGYWAGWDKLLCWRNLGHGMAVSLSNSLPVFGLGRSWTKNGHQQLRQLTQDTDSEFWSGFWLDFISTTQILIGAILLFLLLLTLRIRFRMR